LTHSKFASALHSTANPEAKPAPAVHPLGNPSTPTLPVTVIGGGSWGATLAIHLARKGMSVRLWDADPPHRTDMVRERRCRKYLPEFEFPPCLEVLDEALCPRGGPGFVLLAVPSHALRQVAREFLTDGRVTWIVATKGIEEGTGLTVSQVVREARPESPEPVVVLAGPSLAREVAEGKPCAILAASQDEAAAVAVQRLFATEMFRVYTSADPLGVEIGTSLKNVVALASGILDGLELGQNARGALLTRGLAEIRRLGEAIGARAETFLGLAGVGDLVTTCTSPLSRNHTLGVALGKGEPLESAMARIGMVVEGVRTTRGAVSLAKRLGVEMPIATQVHRILFEGVPPAEALHELMTRPLRAE
jgi:glycerol-3-phosphate dehydrogenase (NAD(P)+)